MFVRRVAASVAAGLLLLSGCSEVEGTDGKEWIAGEGEIVPIAPEDRGDPVEATGETLAGEPIALEDYRGKVLVVNVWAAWCPPCRAEMPDLVKLADGLDPAQAEVVGVNVRDNRGTAEAFVRNAGVEFPSFYDPGSEVVLALSDELGPYSLPSTAVLDREGRLAALVLGTIPGTVTMQDVVEDVAAEDG